MVVYFACESIQPNCIAERDKAGHEDLKSKDAGEVTYSIAVADKTDSEKTQKQRSASSSAANKCFWACYIVNKLAEDIVAFFTAVLCYVVYIQVLLGVSQEKWLRRAYKTSASANALGREANQLALAAFVSTHRPRMRIKHVWLDNQPQGGDPIMVRLVTVNHGDTDARIIESDVVVHAVPINGKPPDEPFMGRSPQTPMMVLPSGKTLDHTAQNAGSVTLEEQAQIYNGRALLYCFAYVDYIDSSQPPVPRKTSCCRVLRPTRGGAISVIRGAFVKTPESEMTEYNYAD